MSGYDRAVLCVGLHWYREVQMNESTYALCPDCKKTQGRRCKRHSEARGQTIQKSRHRRLWKRMQTHGCQPEELLDFLLLDVRFWGMEKPPWMPAIWKSRLPQKRTLDGIRRMVHPDLFKS